RAGFRGLACGCSGSRIRRAPGEIQEQVKRRRSLTQKQDNERTVGGVVGKVVGKAKEFAGEATDRDELAREGRLQQAQSDTERDARRQAADAHRRDAEAQVRRQQVETDLERRSLENEVAS